MRADENGVLMEEPRDVLESTGVGADLLREKVLPLLLASQARMKEAERHLSYCTDEYETFKRISDQLAFSRLAATKLIRQLTQRPPETVLTPKVTV